MFNKILAYFLLFIVMLSCERKPLYLLGDVALKINVEVKSDIDALWNENWRDTLKYNWDEQEHGNIGYTIPENCNLVVFNNGEIVNETQAEVGKRKLIDIDLNKAYDILIYSKEKFWFDTYYDNGNYYIETPSTDTKADDIETVEQPGEVFAVTKNNLFISDDVTDFEEVYEDGRLVYVYNIDERLTPVSYIYIVQFIIINDDNSTIIEAKDIYNFTINGISIKKDLLKNKPVFTDKKQISVYDIKPKQELKDSVLFASRVTILDLLPSNEETSWTSTVDYMCFTNIDVNTYNYGEVKGTKDITDQLKKNPKGGIITIIILNSELKKSGETGSDFGIDVNNWDPHTYDVG